MDKQKYLRIGSTSGYVSNEYIIEDKENQNESIIILSEEDEDTSGEIKTVLCKMDYSGPEGSDRKRKRKNQ